MPLSSTPQYAAANRSGCAARTATVRTHRSSVGSGAITSAAEGLPTYSAPSFVETARSGSRRSIGHGRSARSPCTSRPAGMRRQGAHTLRPPCSATPKATAGCYRTSQAGFPDGNGGTDKNVGELAELLHEPPSRTACLKRSRHRTTGGTGKPPASGEVPASQLDESGTVPRHAGARDGRRQCPAKVLPLAARRVISPGDIGYWCGRSHPRRMMRSDLEGGDALSPGVWKPHWVAIGWERS